MKGWNDVGFHNGCDYPSPHIDDLAASSLELSNYYVQHLCTPSRSALMSGLYPIHTGLQHRIIGPTSPYGLPLDLTLIPQDLKKVGYDTHLIGKWHLGFFSPDYLPTSRGFDSFLGYYLGAEHYFYHNRSYQGVHGYDLRNYTDPIQKDNQYSTHLFGNETLRLMTKHVEEEKENPFFIYLSFQAVHTPLEAPQHIIDMFNESIPDKGRRKLAAMMTVLDDVIGDIVDYLKSDESGNLWDDTMMIFVC